MIAIESVASGKEYRIGKLAAGELQYMDRDYRFAYIPEKLKGYPFIMVHGDDKLIAEDQPCFTIRADYPCDVYILYPDKQPEIPVWLKEYERIRMNVTRTDSNAETLKGYFSLYHKRFPAGQISFYGNSPKEMLAKEWYVSTNGTNYCMYSVAIKETE